tara:strand:- start:3109 stop:3525 length:417 start_codon:yes stop_codon:yes gene_type:complete
MKNIFFNKKNNINDSEDIVLITALLVHAAKMDENYTIDEKKIIEKALSQLTKKNSDEISQIITLAEKKESEANHILNFTKEIKKKDINFRKEIINVLWQIILSDGKSDMYESNLIRRVCGLLYISDKESGDIKLKNKI